MNRLKGALTAARQVESGHEQSDGHVAQAAQVDALAGRSLLVCGDAGGQDSTADTRDRGGPGSPGLDG